ncbi:universal stress protein [Rhodovulum sp. BSW8]|uniref:Nucleotide-binding universal stress UspA family protein n=1 Tax=Rhodovulum visakhapatnamense TaxID=364297 RepID=A0A4R8FC67_9RHOB|nr:MULTISPECIES: universal stress protein [Rhodovulum]OLS46110.1 universal stress protein [Rhodovulum sulfidophilum]MBL3571608.1 universal stress protein [Rhodovulum visakhapatnamense]MBL3579034.1 universal stress protein [Rhodovulum visakhapatnamense]RBO55128.1 universal stress protein [Rhodovulum sp. BSW8]TDX23364.1 nucleotide-binding universal stress UspA family protein [Rhodovulum visakhapatnamense]
MYANILVPVAVDHAPDLADVLEIARRLRATDGTITVLTVAEAIPPYMAQYLPEGQEEETRAAIRTELTGALAGVGDVEIRVVTGHAGMTIVDYAERHGVDCIVMHSHRPELKDYFLGSTAARVVRHAHCAVHVVR